MKDGISFMYSDRSRNTHLEGDNRCVCAHTLVFVLEIYRQIYQDLNQLVVEEYIVYKFQYDIGLCCKPQSSMTILIQFTCLHDSFATLSSGHENKYLF